MINLYLTRELKATDEIGRPIGPNGISVQKITPYYARMIQSGDLEQRASVLDKVKLAEGKQSQKSTAEDKPQAQAKPNCRWGCADIGKTTGKERIS
jgi:hypothetical protein